MKQGGGRLPAPRVIWFIWFLLVFGPGAAMTASAKPVVIVYTSQDEEYADPIFKEFERQTGIAAKAVFDSEAVKTVGLVNRLIAEASHPRCDVFWNNEEFRTREMAARGIFRETNGWVAMGFRSRRIVINTNLVAMSQAPKLFSDATNSLWRGKLALSYPLFGTTSTHFFALRGHWGAEGWGDWCRALEGNKPFLVDGNSIVVRMVGGGEAAIGFTDSDDIAAGQREGLPVAALPVNDETMRIPNTVAVLRAAPHPAEAQKLFEYLQSRAVLDKLVTAHALESVDVPMPGDRGLQPDWPGMIRNLETATKELKGIFLR